MLPLSVCMIVKNEEASLGKTLEAIQGIAQELIVLDTGSSDSTRDIARQFGAAVSDFQWVDDFSAARNAAIAKATQPYILIVDADEVLTPGGHSALEAYINAQPGQQAGRVSIQNILEDKTVITNIPRVFPNQPGFYFEGKIHEQLMFQGKSPQTVETKITLIHSGYLAQERARKDTFNRNTRLIHAELVTRPNDPYLLYQLGKTYFTDQRPMEAMTYFQRAVDQVSLSESDQYPPFLPSLLVAMGYTLMNLELWESLYNVLETGTQLYPDFTDLYFLFGLSLVQNNTLEGEERLAEIEKAFQKCLELGEMDPARYDTVAGVGSYLAHFNLGLFYESQKNLPAARTHYEQAARAGFSKAQEQLEQLNSLSV